MEMGLLKRLWKKDKSVREEKTAHEITEHNSQIIVGIPGLWESEQDLVKSLLEDQESEFLLVGSMCFDPRAQEHCWLDIREFNPRVRNAFEVAGGGKISKRTLNLLDQHKHCAYLIFDDPSPEKAKTAIRFTNAFLRAGGIAVNVESAGIAHDRHTWIERATKLDEDDLYFLFIQLVGSGNQYYSCGMQNFGLPDSEVSSVDNEEAAHILNEFNSYRLTENPNLVDGDVVMLPPTLRFRLSWREYEGYDPETPLYNTWGKWLLEPLPAVIDVQPDDPRMTKAFAEARSTVEQFIHALQNPKPSQLHFSVKVPIGEGDDVRHIWLDSVQFQDGKFTGIVGNEPGTMTVINVGDGISAAPEEISDWMYVEDGKLIGGFTLRAIRAGMSEREGFEFDRSMSFSIESSGLTST
jgi:uncharacterized protein YegJ (DUF2314 family)